jgi:hypothetical protein
MATIKGIEFNDAGEPESVTLRMSVEEAAFIAKFTGQQSSVTAEKVMPAGGGVASSALYNTLTGYVFQPYWDGGVDEYLQSARLHT